MKRKEHLTTEGLEKIKQIKSKGLSNDKPSSAPRRMREVESESFDHTKEIIFGSILGKGKLELPPRGINARFGFTQGEGNKDYFISVCNSLSMISSSKYREYNYIDKRTGKTYKSLNFWTKALPMLTELYHLFYFKKVKRVPSDLSLLTPLALAH
jgi:hypothetical protein